MSKTIVSPVNRWPGTIVLPDYLNLTQALAWEDATKDAISLLPDVEFPRLEDGTIDKEKLLPEHIEYFNVSNGLKYAEKMLPGIMSCVSEWKLENFDPQNFPATPRQSRVRLFAWLITEITNLYKEADEIPNA